MPALYGGRMPAGSTEGDGDGGSATLPSAGARIADRGILRAEQLIYGVAAVALVAGAAALLVQAVVDFVGHLDDVVVATTELLGVLPVSYTHLTLPTKA